MAGGGAGGLDQSGRALNGNEGKREKDTLGEKTNITLKATGTLLYTHVGAVEKVPDGQQSGQDAAERLVFLQLVHPFLQVLQRLGYFLQQDKFAVRKVRLLPLN